MGCSFSCHSSSVSVCKTVRVVQLNGYVEEFDYPVSVTEVTAKLPKHFVCTHAQLLSTCSKPLMPGTFLEPGQIYFLLPCSVFQSNVSLVDLAPLVKKLNNIAKTCRSKGQSGNRNSYSGLNGSTSSPVWRSPASSNRFSDMHGREETENCSTAFDPPRSSKSRSWKPILATIRERSFNRRSESDLQEKS
ncbi:hypothetical protein ACH5RR_006790 [Cinchona calisaya]|uniref:DUF4228 domain-containing protein n=1 Tax=Cinchona calisaya TaxID=153742 RepID=A0ABD3AQF8_9GENT